MLSRLIMIPLSVGCNKANEQKHIFTFWHYTADFVLVFLISPCPSTPPKKWPAVAPADSLPSCCLPQPPIKPLTSRTRLGQRARASCRRRGLLGSPQRLTHTHTMRAHTHGTMCVRVCVIHSCTKVKANDTLSCATNQRQSDVHSCVFGITGTAGLCKMSKHIYDTCV